MREPVLITTAFAVAAVVVVGLAYYRAAPAQLAARPPEPSFAHRVAPSDNLAGSVVLTTANSTIVPEPARAPPPEPSSAVVKAIALKPASAPLEPARSANPTATTETDVCVRHQMRREYYQKRGYRYWRCVKTSSASVRHRKTAAR